MWTGSWNLSWALRSVGRSRTISTSLLNMLPVAQPSTCVHSAHGPSIQSECVTVINIRIMWYCVSCVVLRAREHKEKRNKHMLTSQEREPSWCQQTTNTCVQKVWLFLETKYCMPNLLYTCTGSLLTRTCGFHFMWYLMDVCMSLSRARDQEHKHQYPKE